MKCSDGSVLSEFERLDDQGSTVIGRLNTRRDVLLEGHKVKVGPKDLKNRSNVNVNEVSQKAYPGIRTYGAANETFIT